METKAGTSRDVFYEINKSYGFDFPHTNCDEYSNNELRYLYFKQSGFGAYCRRIVAGITGIVCDLDELEHNSQFVNYVIVWMRLKFVCEQIDPVRYAQYFDTCTKPPKLLPPNLLALYKADSTEFYSRVNTLANKIQLAWIEIMMGNNLDESDMDCDHDLENTCMRINSELQTIRVSECGAYVWKGVDPYELSIYPFLQFQHDLRRVFRWC
jgi:hypothetical protein